MLKNGSVYCPHCNEILIGLEILDNGWYEKSYIDTVTGTCPCCHKTYQWSEIYRFADIGDFGEVTES